MNDRRMGDLVRMAMEVEEIEREASEGAPRLRLVGAEEPHAHRQPTRAWWVGMTAAAAAILAMAAALPLMLRPPATPTPGPAVVEKTTEPTPAPSPEPKQPATVIVQTPHVAPSATANPTAPAFDAGSVERCVVLAIYRDQRGSMRCADVRPQEWQGNKCLSEVTTQEIKTVSLERPCTPDADRALLVAMAGPQRALPKNQAEAEGVASCILRSPNTEGFDDIKPFISAASGCVSPEVAVKIESVGVR
jgi:hypothetical protein